MSRLKELKEKYAVQQGFDSWKELWFETTNYKHANDRIDELIKIYTEECIKNHELLIQEMMLELDPSTLSGNYEELIKKAKQILNKVK